MSKRIYIVSHSLPSPSSNGGPMTVWSIMLECLRKKLDVRVGAFSYQNDIFLDEGRKKQITDSGAQLEVVKLGRRPKVSALSKLTSSIDTIFPDTIARRELIEDIERFKPDAIFLYHWDSIASLHGYDKFPKLGIAGDPWNLPGLRSWQQLKPSISSRYLKLGFLHKVQAYFAPRTMAKLLKGCRSYGSFQAEEAETLSKLGATDCQYYRTSVADPISAPKTLMEKRGNLETDIPTILLGPSNIEATSTKAAVRFFAADVYPHLKRLMNEEPFVVRIVGEGTPPEELANLLPSKHFELPGRIEPPDHEFLSSTIQLVCTPFVLGIRVRIITGFAYGCCVVAHNSEKANIPELIDEENCLIGNDGKSIAEKIAYAFKNPGERNRISEAARRDYDELFSPEKAAGKAVDELIRIAAFDGQ